MPFEEHDHTYSIYVGLIFVFNLIVGTGALTLPSLFHQTGWLLSSIVIIILAFMSYITTTFVIECIACTSAFHKWQILESEKKQSMNESQNLLNEDDRSNSSELENSKQDEELLLSRTYYNLNKKIEMGEMASVFLNEFGRTLFYICIIAYLYGDLTIYSAAASTSLRDVICYSLNATSKTDFEEFLCWPDYNITRFDAYRISLLLFATFLCPFVFFNVQKTKYIQITTIIFRWSSFFVMIILAVIKMIKEGIKGTTPMVSLTGLPTFFGACVYSFMCHHSLPSLIAPIKNKTKIKMFMFIDYLIICSFYILLAMTGIFAFSKLEDLYTLNFIPTTDQNMGILRIIEYFLALFPVFTISASFPIIAITLTNNLQTLFGRTLRRCSYKEILEKVVFPLLAISPPIIVTFFTENINNLIGFTGAYAGTSIQYLIPTCLVYSARKKCKTLLGPNILNAYRSPFQSTFWIVFVILWSSGCLIMVTVKFTIF